MITIVLLLVGVYVVFRLIQMAGNRLDNDRYDKPRGNVSTTGAGRSRRAMTQVERIIQERGDEQ